MARQHAAPVILLPDGRIQKLQVLQLSTVEGNSVSEYQIQQLIADHPSVLPIAEINRSYEDAVHICCELNTPAGPIDNFLVTRTGLPVIIECKLWRNPEGRREVVGQILDYAKELSRFTSADIQRETNRRLNRAGDTVFELVRAVYPDIDQIEFNDSLTQNLNKGRFLLLIVGDGIRQGVEAIAEYLGRHSGLQFTLGLVELVIFTGPDGMRLIVPRTVAHTEMIKHTVFEIPPSMELRTDAGESAEDSILPDDEISLASAERQKFWADFLQGLVLDDPEQSIGSPPKLGHHVLYMPVPDRKLWLTIFRDMKAGKVGIFLSYSQNTTGQEISNRLLADWNAIRRELGGTAELFVRDNKERIGDSLAVGSLSDPEIRKQAFEWLRKRTNDFVNVLRPRIRTACKELEDNKP
jgi:hypothetical protein